MSNIRLTVQPGTTGRLSLEVVTDPVQKGKAGAFALREAVASVDGTPRDLVDEDDWIVPAMVERAFKPSGAATAAVTDDPSFSAGSGPDSEDAWTIEVDSTVDFAVNDLVRAALQPDGEGQVYRVLSIPDGTSLVLHGKSGGMDIVDGDTVEVVESSGTYCGIIEMAVDDLFDASKPTGTIRVIIETVDSGDVPHFTTSQILTWNFDIQLDLGSRQYQTG